MRPPRRLIAAATAALSLLLVPAGLSAAPADAAASRATKAPASNALTPGRLANIAMSDANSFARGAADRAAAEASHPQLRVGSVADVIGSGAQQTRAGCHPSELLVTTTWRSLCWSEQDDSAHSWYPQGITGSGDAAKGAPYYIPCPGCPGRKVVAVSWHNGPNTLAKVSFVDVGGGMAGAPYDDTLLVVPDTARGFRPLASHASGISWYGRYLYLFSSGEKAVQVFDLTRIWAMNNPTGTSIGCDPATGGCAAAGVRFVIPRIGYYRFADGFGCWGRIGLNPCFSSVSLDRATKPDTLVTTEFNERSGGRIVRWPLNAATGRLLPVRKGGHKIIPIAGWKSTLKRQQGAAFYGRNGVVAAMCPAGAPGVSYRPDGRPLVAGVSKSCLYKATLSSTKANATLRTTYWTTGPRGLQNVSYWPGSKELWTLNEFPGNATQEGSRQIIALDCPGLVCG